MESMYFVAVHPLGNSDLIHVDMTKHGVGFYVCGTSTVFADVEHFLFSPE